MKERPWILPTLWLALALLWSLAMMGAAWDHNPMGAYHDWETGEIDWPGWLDIGGRWFAVVGLLPVIGYTLIRVGYEMWRRRWVERSSEPPSPFSP